MTQRDFYNAIINGTITEDVINTAKAQLAKMDATNEKRRNTPTKAQKENAPLVDKIVNEVLGETPKTASEIAAELEITVQKASALLRSIVANGQAVSTDVKLPKKGTVKAYTLA
jgi:predicted Rossmann fold nucleotide-binding protein DprA/Smf involved in DNA uptake